MREENPKNFYAVIAMWCASCNAVIFYEKDWALEYPTAWIPVAVFVLFFPIYFLLISYIGRKMKFAWNYREIMASPAFKPLIVLSIIWGPSFIRGITGVSPDEMVINAMPDISILAIFGIIGLIHLIMSVFMFAYIGTQVLLLFQKYYCDTEPDTNSNNNLKDDTYEESDTY